MESAGATRRFGPTVKRPATFNPTLSEKTGSVMMLTPKKFTRMVECPSQHAVIVALSQVRGRGTWGAGRIGSSLVMTPSGFRFSWARSAGPEARRGEKVQKIDVGIP